jgi:hypothetical protein
MLKSNVNADKLPTRNVWKGQRTQPHTTQQQGPVARSTGGHQTKTGQGTRQSTHL